MTTFASYFWRWVHRSEASASARWALIGASILALTPVLGTGGIALLIAAIAPALAYLALAPGRFLPMKASERWIAAIFASYYFVGLAFALARPNWLQGLKSVGWNNFAFAGAILLLPVVRAFFRPYWSLWLGSAAAAGGMLAGIVALAGNGRIEALTGNPLVFAYLCGATALINGCLALNSRRKIAVLHSLAALSASVALLLSGSRGPIVLVAAIGLCLLLVWAIGAARREPGYSALIVYGAAIACAVVYSLIRETEGFVLLIDRFNGLVGAFVGSSIDASYTDRVEMLRAGWSAFTQQPLLGYGRQNVMAVANAQFPHDPHFGYSHLHNALLTEAVAAGILGALSYCLVLITPIIATWRGGRKWRMLGIAFAAHTALLGWINISFYHDIMTFYFCGLVVYFSALATNAHAALLEDYRAFLAASPAYSPPDRPTGRAVINTAIESG